MDRVAGDSDDDPPYERLLYRVCCDMGWCGSFIDGRPSHVDDYIPEHGLVSADQFVDWIFAADGYGPELAPAEQVLRFRASIRNAFKEIMGDDVVDASRLKWSL